MAFSRRSTMHRRNAPKKPASKNVTKPIAKAANISRDEVAQEAFKMFQSRHGAPGDPVADWFEAEKIVRARVETKPPKAAEAAAAAGNGRNGARRHSRRRR
jgi:hypothetical protein